jgi:hypothetical protein
MKGPEVLKKLACAALVAAFAQGESFADAGEAARADAARKKPLQRCDQLQDQAEIECLKKARERIVEARQQRESSAKGDAKAVAKK